ncbi:MAG: tetratricopeptide repeat protein [Elusimicrobiales bacterium]|nr:tetratricopeptide repeat protein [Elusimicrobiales bacterium]
MGKKSKAKTGHTPDAELASPTKLSLWMWLPLIAAFIVYLNTLHNGFLYGDDEHIVLRNRFLDDWHYLPQIFTQNLWAGSGEVSNFYRPLPTLLYAAITHVFGRVEWPYHLLNIAFHGLCGALSAVVLSRCLPAAGAAIPVMLALLWTVHPLSVEQIACPTSTPEPMHFFFLLAALLPLVGRLLKKSDSVPSETRWQAGYLSLFACALLCKESAVVLPLLAVILHLALSKTGRAAPAEWRGLVKIHLPSLALAGVYTLLRLTWLNFSNTLNFYNSANVYTDSLYCRLLTLAAVLGKGVQIIFLPYDLQPERAFPVFCSFASPEVLLPCAALAAGAWYSYSALKRNNPLPAAGLGWFLAAFLPVSNLVSRINGIFWDHWFYAPLLGLCLALGDAAQRVKRRKALFWLAAAYLLVFSALTVRRNTYWRDQETYSGYVLKMNPGSAKHWNNLAIALDDKGNTDAAMKAYKKAIETSDTYPQSRHNLGQLYLKTGRPDLAEAEYESALRLEPRFYQSHLALAQISLNRADYKAARRHLEQAKEIYPYYPGIDDMIRKVRGYLPK